MPELSITVDRVAYPPVTSESNWYILITSHGTVKGSMSWRPEEQEQLIVTGEWGTYKGQKEFKFDSARLNIPTDPRDQLRYVCARTSGLGPAAEQSIWDIAGADWQGVDDKTVPRLSGRVYANFKLQLEALVDKSEEANVIAALMGKGATMGMASAAWEKWKLETMGVVHADCYRLAELENYSFRNVDRAIRQSYGIGDDDPRRIRAAVVYTLRQLTSRGDTVIGWDELYSQAVGLLGGYAELINECQSKLFEEGTLKAFKGGETVSLAADWKAEVDIWEFVKERANRDSAPPINKSKES